VGDGEPMLHVEDEFSTYSPGPMLATARCEEIPPLVLDERRLFPFDPALINLFSSSFSAIAPPPRARRSQYGGRRKAEWWARGKP